MDECGTFGTRISRDLLLNKISLLAMLGPVREGYQEHSLTSQDHPKRVLTIDQEAEIVRNLSFLAYRRKDSCLVVALCIEEHEDGEGMTVRFTVNGNKVLYVREGLHQICTTLENISQKGNSETYDVELLFRVAVRLDFSRISARLRLGKKYRVEASPVVQIYNLLLRSSKGSITDAKIDEFQFQLEKIVALYYSLRSNFTQRDDPTVLNVMEQIIKEAHHLSRCSQFFTTLQDLPEAEASHLELLKDQVDKLGHYYGACVELVRAARRKRYRIFQRIQVENFEVRVPESVRAPSTCDSALNLIKTLNASSDISKVLRKFQNSESRAAAALASRVNGTRSAIKVHAEVKLVFYYELHPNCITPRVISANKSACYLCDLFLKVHGQFQVPATFGKLTERWILPDWLDNIQADRLSILQRTVKQFNNALDVQIKRLLKGVRRMPDPKESTIGLPAHWSASSFEDPSYAAPHMGRPRTQATAPSSEVHQLATHLGYRHRLMARGVNSSIALSHPRGLQIGRFIRDHKSRSCEKLSAYDMVQSDDSVQKINFHDLELFLETGYPSRGRLTALRCSEPTDLSGSFININEMKSGEELILKFTEVFKGEKHIYFSGRGHSGLASWWKISCQ